MVRVEVIVVVRVVVRVVMVVMVEVVDGRVVVAGRCGHPAVPLRHEGGRCGGAEDGAGSAVGGQRRGGAQSSCCTLRHADRLRGGTVTLLRRVAWRRTLAVAMDLTQNRK